MAVELSVAKAPATNYLAIFCQGIVRAVKELLTRTQQAAQISDDNKQYALQTLNYALKVDEAWPLTSDLLLTLAPKMEQAGYWEEWMVYLKSGIQQSQKLADVEAEGELRFHLGLLLQHLSKFAAAGSQFELSAELFKKNGNPHHQARALNRWAAVARRQQDFSQATRLVDVALGLLSEEAKEEIAYCYFVLGGIAGDERDWQNAFNFFSKSLALREQTNNPRLIAWGLINLGGVLRTLERYAEARACYERAMNLFDTIQDPVHQAIARMNLGNIYLDLGQPLQAMSCYLLAETIFQKTKAGLLLAQVKFNKGLASEQLGQWERATELYLASIEQRQQIGTVSLIIKVIDQLGMVYLQQGRADQAIATFQDALNQCSQIENEAIHHHFFTLLSTHLDEAKA